MSQESHKYHVRVDWTSEREGELTLERKPKMVVASPPEFGGPEGIISPEDLFVASAATCFMTTFIHFVDKMHIEHKSFSCEGVGTLEKGEKGFQFTRILLKSTVVIDSEDLRPKMERALELAEEYCLVSNSMKCPTDHQNSIVVE